jgi:hypothetical protein
LNGGKGVTSEIFNGDILPFELTTSVMRRGYKFGGWHSNAQLTGDPIEYIPDATFRDIEY